MANKLILLTILSSLLLGAPTLLNDSQAFANRSNIESVKLSSVRFHRKSSSRGHWRGRVSGSGNVRLYLDLYAGGRALGKKYIGSVELDRGDGPVLFSFLSDTPPNRRWKWKIIARRG